MGVFNARPLFVSCFLITEAGFIIFDHPVIAVPIGLVIGFAMMGAIVFLPRLEKTGEPLKRLPYTVTGAILAFIIGTGMIFAYHALAPHYFVWFGVTTIATFLVTIAARTVPQIRQLKRRV